MDKKLGALSEKREKISHIILYIDSRETPRREISYLKLMKLTINKVCFGSADSCFWLDDQAWHARPSKNKFE